MSEQNANMILPDAPEKIFSGEVNDVNVSQKGHDTQGTNEKGVDEAIKSETETKTETEARIKTGAEATEATRLTGTNTASVSGTENTESNTESNTEANTEANTESAQAKLAKSAKLISSSPLSRVNFVNIPRALKSSCSFCVWRKEKRNGKAIKIPYDPKTGQMAKTNDPSTFSDFATAMKVYAP